MTRTTIYIEKLNKDIKLLREALSILVDHAQEKYPHFENGRGQDDIERALKALEETGVK